MCCSFTSLNLKTASNEVTSPDSNNVSHIVQKALPIKKQTFISKHKRILVWTKTELYRFRCIFPMCIRFVGLFLRFANSVTQPNVDGQRSQQVSAWILRAYSLQPLAVLIVFAVRTVYVSLKFRINSKRPTGNDLEANEAYLKNHQVKNNLLLWRFCEVVVNCVFQALKLRSNHGKLAFQLGSFKVSCNFRVSFWEDFFIFVLIEKSC